ncbi:hypothetical protein G7Y89_g7226 [Cudoniella acicularis]|uniref:alpha-glucosidase n=1 Tax=Cudoniella acicularis TaxID=354080 RepID=A0A8H4RMH2_9HELO|nr:hypothetical protein G7Y89_g7226 [Cudoniella acicularis]
MDGHVELDVHNIYGAMMSQFSRDALEARRPGRRPMVITRSTFAGSGKAVGKWLGDNLSTWELYRNSIQGMLDFAAVYQMPMVGSDVCGFGANTTEALCARLAMLGAFNPLYRNYNGDSSIAQEFYLWEIVTAAAKIALDIRYRLLDYIYTALYKQSTLGTPILNPLFFVYPEDSNTFGIELQFFYEEHLLLGVVIPIRASSAYTTTEVRQQPFNFLIAPNEDSEAKGSLYRDGRDNIVQNAMSEIAMVFKDNVLVVSGSFGYQDEGSWLKGVVVLGVEKQPKGAYWGKVGYRGMGEHAKCESIDFCVEPDVKVNFELGFPESGGVRVLDYGRLLDGSYAPCVMLKNALTMEERCGVIEKLGGKFCETKSAFSGYF